MKPTRLLTRTLALLTVSALHAQTPVDPLIEPVAPVPPAVQADLQEIPGKGVVPTPGPLDGQTPPPAVPMLPSDNALLPSSPPDSGAPLPPPAAAAVPFGPLEKQKQETKSTEKGFIIKDAGLNDIFQFLAKSAGRQYFHNTKIAGPEFLVTGHLNDGSPLAQMEELAFMYGLSLHTKGNTIYALTQAQLAQLPSAEFHYQLRYLRPTDMEQIKELIKPMLSPGTGIVNFEPKTNTVVIIDSAHRIEQARELLHGIDKAQGQIIVETKILRINSAAGKKQGVNWSGSLGKGVTLDVARDLNSVFGLDGTTGFFGFGNDNNKVSNDNPTSNLVLSTLQLRGVLKALNDGGLAKQISNPTLITEDNELATISIIDRIPIVTSSITPGTGGSPSIVTEQLRYKIDSSDKAITEDPQNHREIGISIVVTPTLLPDGTIRMKLRPRSAQVVGEVRGVAVGGLPGNSYPRVTESMVESIARVPDGSSLVVGGFYGEVQKKDDAKIPLLGDLPVLNFFFKSKDTSKESTSLVFIVTPKSYDPSSKSANKRAGNQLRSSADLKCDHDWIDQDNPGPAHEANLKRTLRDMQPTQAPYYPRADELAPEETRSPAPRNNSSGFSKASRR